MSDELIALAQRVIGPQPSTFEFYLPDGMIVQKGDRHVLTYLDKSIDTIVIDVRDRRVVVQLPPTPS